MPDKANDPYEGRDSNLVGKIKHLEELNRTIAHNLRGGVANIKLLAELLMEKKLTKPGKENKGEMSTGEGLQYIYDSSMSLLASLNAFLELSEIHTNKNVTSEDCDIAGAVKQVTYQLQGTIQQKNAHMHTFLAVTHIHYPCIYLESILYNLISNALKYSKPDVPVEIIISSYTENDRTILRVKDNGIGMNLAAYGHKVFKLNQTFHQGYESRGFGLYMTRVQVEMMGGTISVSSEVGKGTEFIVTF